MKVRLILPNPLRKLRGAGGIVIFPATGATTIDGSGIVGTGGGINTSNIVAAVGSTGFLTNVYAAAAATNTYPSAGAWSTGSGNVVINSTGLNISTGSGYVSVPFAAITRGLSLRTITVCDSGVTRSMDLIASQPY